MQEVQKYEKIKIAKITVTISIIIKKMYENVHIESYHPID